MPFMTFAAEPPGQYVGSGAATESSRGSAPSAPTAPPWIHSRAHAARRWSTSRAVATGRHPPGSSMPHASKTRAATRGSSRRTRISLTGSPRPTTRPGEGEARPSAAARRASADGSDGPGPTRASGPMGGVPGPAGRASSSPAPTPEPAIAADAIAAVMSTVGDAAGARARAGEGVGRGGRGGVRDDRRRGAAFGRDVRARGPAGRRRRAVRGAEAGRAHGRRGGERAGRRHEAATDARAPRAAGTSSLDNNVLAFECRSSRFFSMGTQSPKIDVRGAGAGRMAARRGVASPDPGSRSRCGRARRGLMNNAVKKRNAVGRSKARKESIQVYTGRSLAPSPPRRARARVPLAQRCAILSAYGSGATMDMSTGRRISRCQVSPNTMHRKSCLKKVMKTYDLRARRA